MRSPLLLLAALVAATSLAGCHDATDSKTLGHASTASTTLSFVQLGEDGAERGYPTLAIDGLRGLVYIAFVSTRDNQSDAYLLRSDDGGRTFGLPVRVNDAPGTVKAHLQAPPAVAVGPEGEVYVMWVRNVAVAGSKFGHSYLHLATSRDGGASFGAPIQVADGDVYSSRHFHDLDVLPDGTVIASWLYSDKNPGAQGGPAMQVARSTDRGASFGPPASVDDLTCACCQTSLAVAPDGTTFLAWRDAEKQGDAQVRDLALARSRDGARSFDRLGKLHDDGWVFDKCPHTGPSLAVDGAGALHAAWYTGAEGAAGLYYAVARSDAAFGDPVPLLGADWVMPSVARIAPREGGGAWLLWENKVEDPTRMEAAYVDALGVLTRIPDTLGTGNAPAIASGSGGVVMTWVNEGALMVASAGVTGGAA